MNTLDLGRWLILLVSSQNTLRLAASLREDGYEAWAPTETVKRRSREGAKPEPVILPLMAGFVFARADRLADLLALSHSPSMLYQVWDVEQRKMVTKGHPYFRVFKHAGEPYSFPDHQLDPLRALEQRTTPRGKDQLLNVGDLVRLGDGGGLAGLIGEVEAVIRKNAVVRFPKWPLTFNVPVWKLLRVLDCDSRGHIHSISDQAVLAKAA
jgi:hypothetical protein